MQQQLTTITDVLTAIDNQFPPALIISVKGIAPGTGFTDVHLEPYFYDIAPVDGIFEFSFVGIPPQEQQAEIPEAVEAVYRWESFPETLKRISVYADDNSIEKILFETEQPASGLF